MFSEKHNCLNVCQWRECDFMNDIKLEFYEHVKGHIPQLEIVKDNGSGEAYQCLWQDCIFQTSDSKEVIWHVKYHGFHALLKAEGEFLVKSRSLPPCTLSSAECNALPSRSIPLKCQWNNSCDEICTGPLELIQHVELWHVCELKTKKGERMKCHWTDCSFTTTKKSKIGEHVKMHTGDKAAACSQCGQIFANRTKFINHRNRQVPINEQSPQCSHCLVYLPNERILKIHMRQHVHHYKCCFCELTCSTPAILNAHIKYRHLPYKPFKCSHCAYVCKSQNDLNRHLSTHMDSVFNCTNIGCKCKFKSEFALAKHYEEHKESPQIKIFACHLCTKVYSRGSRLTEHFCKVHNVNKPSGYSRFEYRREQDGYFRLQTTRLESLEVEEMKMDESYDNSALKFAADEEALDDPSPVSSVENNEGFKTIAVDLIDDTGKLISCEVLTAKEELPPEATVVAIGE